MLWQIAVTCSKQNDKKDWQAALICTETVTEMCNANGAVVLDGNTISDCMIDMSVSNCSPPKNDGMSNSKILNT